MRRSRAFRLYQRHRKIYRKLRIIHSWHNQSPGFAPPYAEVPGKLSKGKIHCTCWMCRHKSYDELSMPDKRSLKDYEDQLDNTDIGV